MKPHIYILIYTSMLALGLIGLSGCKECRDEQHITYDKFVDSYKAFMGFEGHETLSFLKNNKDTVFFTGQGLQVYYEHQRLPRGNCEADYAYLNHKVIFNNKKEGNIIFHYFTKGEGYSQDMYEVVFQDKNLIEPMDVFQISILAPADSSSIFLGREYQYVRRFSPNNTDSLYLKTSSVDPPKYRAIRIKVNNNIYDVIP